MADTTLEKLFSSRARVKIMRFFLTNPDDIFLVAEAAKILRLKRQKAASEIRLLGSIGFLSNGSKEIEIYRKNKKPKKKKMPGVRLSSLFPYTRAMRLLLIESSSASREKLQKNFAKLGYALKMVVLSGIFSGKSVEGAMDVLIVGDVRRGAVEKILGKIESEIGHELNYTLFSTEEYKYRKSMYDKFINDIFESDHEELINNLGA